MKRRRYQMLWKRLFGGASCLVLLLALASAAAWAQAPAALPKSTQEILQRLKLDPSILKGLDQELNVPRAWIEGARREAKLRILPTFDPPRPWPCWPLSRSVTPL